MPPGIAGRRSGCSQPGDRPKGVWLRRQSGAAEIVSRVRRGVVARDRALFRGFFVGIALQALRTGGGPERNDFHALFA